MFQTANIQQHTHIGQCIHFPQTESDGIDFEIEYGVILNQTPMGVGSSAAVNYVGLLVLINDWSLRTYGPSEMKGGFGFIHAKPPQ